MTAPAINICGIAAPEALDAVIAARADYAGFVFFPPSPRHVTLTQAADLGAKAASKIKRVGLFVDADDSTLADAVSAASLDVLQLHGKETPERAAQLKARFGLPVWKALPVASAEDIQRSQLFTGAVDLVLFDAKTPKGTLPGGMGLRFDWTLLTGLKLPMAWGLAGGLDASNVTEAIRLTAAPLIDASSGVESSPGAKDAAKIAAFCTAVRAA